VLVSYARSPTGIGSPDYIAQTEKIRHYCQYNGLICAESYSDGEGRGNRRADEKERYTALGLNSVCSYVYPGWETLLLDIISGKVDQIIVDNILRLYTNEEQYKVLNQIVSENNVKIIEANMAKDAIFAQNTAFFFHHYSPRKGDGKRTNVILKNVAAMYETAHKMGLGLGNLYISEYTGHEDAFKKLCDDIKSGNTIIFSDLYHIDRKTALLSRKLYDLIVNMGVNVVTLKEGSVQRISLKDLIISPLRVVIYDNARTAYEKEYSTLTIERLKSYTNLRTNWKVMDIVTYNDQRSIQDVVKNTSADLILTDMVSKLASTTDKYVELVTTLKIPIIGLREKGGIKTIG